MAILRLLTELENSDTLSLQASRNLDVNPDVGLSGVQCCSDPHSSVSDAHSGYFQR